MAVFDVYESMAPGRRYVAQDLPTFEAAEAFVRTNYVLVCFEADADYPGCADAYSESGKVICVDCRDSGN